MGKLAIFLRIVAQRMIDLYETAQFAEDEDRSKWSVVPGKLDGLCAPRTSKHVQGRIQGFGKGGVR